MRLWKVGELAKETGITVRALHHYDALGLLSPVQRTSAGHRLYGDGDLVRLHQILSLRQLGFSLEDVRDYLAHPTVSLLDVVHLHIARLRAQIAAQQQFCTRLERLAEHVRRADSIDVADLTHSMELMAMIEKYYTAEQFAAMTHRQSTLGEQRMRDVAAAWPVLIAQVRSAMDRGTDPADDTVQQLAQRWVTLVRDMTGGDAALAQAMHTMCEQEPEVQRHTAIDPAMFAYIARAIAYERATTLTSTVGTQGTTR